MQMTDKEKVRICHIITSLDAGGPSENTLRTVCGFDPNRYQVTIIYGRTDQPLEGWIKRAKERGVDFFSVPKMVREINPITDFRALRTLAYLIDQIKPDIVHTHTSKAGILGRWAARLCRVLIIIHTPHGHLFEGYTSGGVSWIYKIIDRMASKFTDRIVTLTDVEVKHHLEENMGHQDKFVTIPSGIDIRKFRGGRFDREGLRERLRVPEGAVCLGSAGRMSATKNFGLLIEALAVLQERNPDHYQLVLLGEGAERGILYHKSIELGVEERFYMPGWHEDVENYYPGFDLFVLVSKNESMGRVLVESMAAGVPIVATSVGGVPELLGEGEFGLLVPPDDPEALANTIEIIASDHELCRQLIEKGRKRAEIYSADLMIEKINRLYGGLLREHSEHAS